MVISKAASKYIATLIDRHVASLEQTKSNKKSHKFPAPPYGFIPNITNYAELYKYHFTLKQLQAFAKTHRIKTSDVKKDALIHHLYMFLKMNAMAIHIQSHIRGHLQRKLLKMQGFLQNGQKSAFFRNCINDTDFVTLESITDIPVAYFYGYIRKSEKEVKGSERGGMFGFNITSLYNYVVLGNNNINPFTREPFRETLKAELQALVKLAQIVTKSPLILTIEEPECTTTQKMELKAVSIFQTLNELGNYSDVSWFLGLSWDETSKYASELYDIWNHRAGLSSQLRAELCPPDGNLFRHNMHHRMLREHNVCNLKLWLLDIFAKMVQNPAVALDNRKLNAMYILTGLTLVSPVAAEAMPFYFFSVSNT